MEGIWYGAWKDSPPSKEYWGQHYFVHENLAPVDADVLLVFIELDGTVWYGKTKFEMSDFDCWMWIHIEYPEYPGDEEDKQEKKTLFGLPITYSDMSDDEVAQKYKSLFEESKDGED